MYCNNCGKYNPKESKFCQKCGKKIIKKTSSKKRQNVSSLEPVEELQKTTKNPPYPYVISTSKLIILSVSTFGLYNLYWFYKQWKSFKYEYNLKGIVWINALFSTLSAYSLFKTVSKAVDHITGTRNKLRAALLALAYFLILISAKLPDLYGWISFFSFLPLIPVQNAINLYWKTKYDRNVKDQEFGGWNYFWMIVGGITLLLALYRTIGSNATITDALHIPNISGNNTSTDIQTNKQTDTSTTAQNKDLASWITYTAETNQFTVQLPSYPLHKVIKTKSGYTYDSYTTSTDNENTGYFIYTYSTNKIKDEDAFLEDAFDQGVNGLDEKAKVTYVKYSYKDKHRSLEYSYVLEHKNITINGEFIFDNQTNTLYSLLCGYDTNTPDPLGLKLFMNTFQINP